MKISLRALTVLAWIPALMIGTSAPAADEAANTVEGLTIPQSHPRLVWTVETLPKAKQWFKANSFSPSPGSFDNEGSRLDYALHYLFTGNKGSARAAIQKALSVTLPAGQLDPKNKGASSDQARWFGEMVVTAYDWCWPEWKEEERAELIERWNGYLDALRKKDWGGVGMEANNYYWGYLRNELAWGIATYGENPKAEEFIHHALTTRWKKSFLPYAAKLGKGGIVAEGTSYGPVNVWYPLLPFVTCRQHGRDLFAESNFFREAAYALVYGTTPAPTRRKGDGGAKYEYALYNDVPYPDAASQFHSRPYFGDFAGVMAFLEGDEPAGQIAAEWLAKIKPMRSKWTLALRSSPSSPSSSTSKLPLDYYGSGTQYLFARGSWSPETTTAFLQMGRYQRIGHWHQDDGSFQLWRNGKWITRITAGSYKDLVGYNGRKIQNPAPEAHNLLLLNGIGPQKNSVESGDPVVVRLESKPEYAYAAVDLTKAYLSDGRLPSPPITRYVREYLFVRASGALHVCDRVTPKEGVTVTGTFCIHSETAKPPFEIVPGPTRTVNEGDQYGQFRLEIDQTFTGVGELAVKIVPAGVTDPSAVEWSDELGGTFNGQPLGKGVMKCEVTNAGVTWAE